jgi:hypothetical protein
MAEKVLTLKDPIAKPSGLQRYSTLHLWMIAPMIVMQVGIFRDYWGDFTDNAWSVHVHYITGTVWYFYLIIQPYFATHGQLARHRTNGIIGMFVAGGVCLTAFAMLHRDIATTERIIQSPELFGPFQPWFFFGVATVEIVMITAFGFAVIKSILHRKQVEDHSWWLICTVFIIMMPALGRGVQNLYFFINRNDFPNVDIMLPLYIAHMIILAMILFAAVKYNKVRHSATYLAVGVNLFNFLLEPLGRNETIQSLLKTVITG